MSLASILDSAEDISFTEIRCSVLNASVVNATVINGGGGGSGVNITSSDNTVNVTNGKGTVDLTDAGSLWASFPASVTVQMGNNSMTGTSSIGFGGPSAALTLYQGVSGMYLSDSTPNNGNIGNIYDSHFNKPTLWDVLQTSGDAAGNSITRVGQLTVTNGTQTGRVYDDTIYRPPNMSSAITLLSYSNGTGNPQTIVSTYAAAVQWANLDAVNSVGTTGLTFSVSQFTNPVALATTMTLQVSGYVTWSQASTATSTRAIYGARNALGNSDRYGYMNCAAGSDFPCTPFNFTIKLASGDFFGIYVWHNDTSNQTIDIASFPSSRIMITRIA